MQPISPKEQIQKLSTQDQKIQEFREQRKKQQEYGSPQIKQPLTNRNGHDLNTRLDLIELQLASLPEIQTQLKAHEDNLQTLILDNQLFRQIQQKLLDDTISMKKGWATERNDIQRLEDQDNKLRQFIMSLQDQMSHDSQNLRDQLQDLRSKLETIIEKPHIPAVLNTSSSDKVISGIFSPRNRKISPEVNSEIFVGKQLSSHRDSHRKQKKYYTDIREQISQEELSERLHERKKNNSKSSIPVEEQNLRISQQFNPNAQRNSIGDPILLQIGINRSQLLIQDNRNPTDKNTESPKYNLLRLTQVEQDNQQAFHNQLNSVSATHGKLNPAQTLMKMNLKRPKEFRQDIMKKKEMNFQYPGHTEQIINHAQGQVGINSKEVYINFS